MTMNQTPHWYAIYMYSIVCSCKILLEKFTRFLIFMLYFKTIKVLCCAYIFLHVLCEQCATEYTVHTVYTIYTVHTQVVSSLDDVSVFRVESTKLHHANHLELFENFISENTHSM